MKLIKLIPLSIFKLYIVWNVNNILRAAVCYKLSVKGQEVRLEIAV